MEVAVAAPPVPAVDFNFDSTCSSPYMTAPSSPQRFGNLFITTPSRVSFLYQDFNDAAAAAVVPSSSCSSSSAVPFDWEEKPGTPKDRNGKNFSDHDDFEFDFSGHLERTSLSADELFDCGKIRPLKPPPGYDSSVSGSAVSSPRSPKARTKIKKDFDPFEAAMEETRRKSEAKETKHEHIRPIQGRGRRERSKTGSFSSFSSPTSGSRPVRKGSRSMSPLRVSDTMFENPRKDSKIVAPARPSYVASILAAISFSKGYYKKWKLKDFLLFRSASEGRPTVKDEPLTKYGVWSKEEEAAEDVKSASFRSTESSVGGSSRRRSVAAPLLSAHEVHYTVNRAAAEEMKRKTFLPYKQGLLGCLGFNPGLHDMSIRGIGSLPRG